MKSSLDSSSLNHPPMEGGIATSGVSPFFVVDLLALVIFVKSS